MKAATKRRDKYAVDDMSTEDARALFDKNVQDTFKISAEAFIQNYQSGKYEECDDCDMMGLLMLLPFTGYSAVYGNKQKRRS